MGRKSKKNVVRKKERIHLFSDDSFRYLNQGNDGFLDNTSPYNPWEDQPGLNDKNRRAARRRSASKFDGEEEFLTDAWGYELEDFEEPEWSDEFLDDDWDNEYSEK